MINETLTTSHALSAEGVFSPGDVAISVRFAIETEDTKPRVILERKPSESVPSGIHEWGEVATFSRSMTKDYILTVVDGAASYRFALYNAGPDDSVQVIAVD